MVAAVAWASCLGAALPPGAALASPAGEQGAAAHPAQPVKPTSPEAYASTRPSESGVFRVSYRSNPAALPLNALHTWTLTVETAGGEPVREADIAVEVTMPEHGHGMPTKPAVTKSFGDGTYLVEGLKFSMPGWWVLTFKIRADAASDVVTFHVQLD
jgi:hypothetical protein